MSADVFDFPFHLQRTTYPDSGVRMQFGGGYEFASQPADPDQRIFTLTFQGMRYITNEDGTLDLATDGQKNFGKLEKFYQDHRMWDTFIYPHPAYGNVTVRFHKPLEGPKGVPGGYGVVESFEVELIEQLT